MPMHLPYFSTAKTYADLIEANIKFLKGELLQTPYHYGSINDETLPIVDDLIKLNQYGFITVQSQPAANKVGFVDKIWYTNGQKMGNWWYASQQKPFVEGYLPIADLSQFISYMSNTEYYYAIFALINQSNRGILKLICPQTHIVCEMMHSNMPPVRCYNLTREKSSATKLGLSYIEWEHYTNFWMTHGPDYDFADYPNIDNILLHTTVKVFIIGKEYNQGSATDVMLKFYELQK